MLGVHVDFQGMGVHARRPDSTILKRLPLSHPAISLSQIGTTADFERLGVGILFH
jgi:hypothetical protein